MNTYQAPPSERTSPIAHPWRHKRGGASEEDNPSISQKSVVVSDGVRLSYLEAGSGKTLLLIPGWSQTAEQFRFQLEGLATTYRVIALDMRGHGDSDKPTFGQRIQRLAKDVHDVLEALDLTEVTTMGHSMGCSVLWCHFDLFGSTRISKYVFCDQATSLVFNPNWTPEQTENYGAIFTPDAVTATYNALVGPDGVAATKDFLRSMVTSAMPAAQFQWIYERNLKMPRQLAADLLSNHCHQDWRDVLPRIEVPTLFIGAKGSLVPYKAMLWESTRVPGSQAAIFEAHEGGSHFMFIENPSKFNGLISSFMG